MINAQEVKEIIGSTVFDSGGKKIGDVGQVYFDTATGQPEWLTVKTGLFGTKESFVPLSAARVRPDHQVEVGVDKDAVTKAPSLDVEQELSQEDEARVYRHYGMPYGDQYSPTGLPESGGRAGETAGTVRDAGAAPGRDADEAATDEAMTRSEERVRVGTSTEAAGRARLRKYVVTEPVEQTVQVTREEARVEREPITDANRDAAMSGPDITESEHEVTLHAETPVVQKEAVPVERVRLTTDQVSEEQTVSDEVRKERIETDGDVQE